MKNENLKLKGIDLSYCQRSVDYNALKRQGISYAVIRTGYRQKTDDMLYTHMDGCNKAGIKFGVYVYALATTEEEARSEAGHALKSIEGYKLDYPVFYDLEDERLLGLTSEQRTKNALAFLETVLKAVYYPGIYANPAWLENYLIKDSLAGFDIWLAAWTGSPDVPTKYNYKQKMWQWGLDDLEGVGKVDGNLCYIDYPSLIKAGGFNNCDCGRSGNDVVVAKTDGYAVFRDCNKEYICAGRAVKLRKLPNASSTVIKVLEQGGIYRAINEIYEGNTLKWLYFKDEGGYSMMNDQLGDTLFVEKRKLFKVGDKVRITKKYAASAYSAKAYNSIYIGEERFIVRVFNDGVFPYQLGTKYENTESYNTTGFANDEGIVKIQ